MSAISLPSFVDSNSGAPVTYWVPSNINASATQVSFAMNGFVKQGDTVPILERFYDNGSSQNNITPAVFAQCFPATLTLSGIPLACCQAALATLDVNGASFFNGGTITS
jgi:hypothetical protein